MHNFIINNIRWLSAGMLLTFLSSFGQTYFISIFSGEIRNTFELSHGNWGLIYGFGTFASAIIMIWAGGLTDIRRVRKLGPIVLYALSASCLFMALNPLVALLPVVIFCLRLTGQGMSTHIATVAMSRWFLSNRGKALSISNLGFSFGEALFPLFLVSGLIYFSWQKIWIIAALITLFSIPILIWLLHQERSPQSIDAKDQSLGMNKLHWTRKETISHPLFWLMMPAVIGQSAFNTAFFFQQVHFSEIKGWEHLDLVSMFPIYTCVAICTMILSGILLDRLGTAKLIPYFQLPMIIAFILFAFGETLYSALLGFIFLGMTAGANTTLPNAFWAEFFGTKYLGSIKAAAAAAMVLGSAIGPALTGILLDYGISLSIQYIGISTFFILSSMLMWIGVSRAQINFLK
jgi:MFS family permease